MRVLILGGTWFLGAAVARAAISRGMTVTTFNRGKDGHDVIGVSRIRGDRESDADLARLSRSGNWHAVIDTSGTVPAVVQKSARALSRATGMYTFISSIAVYRDWRREPITEASTLHHSRPDLDPGTRNWNSEQYGPLKVGCEIAVRDSYGASRALVLRPGVIVGPGDYVGRLEWWLRRVRRGGDVLAPGGPQAEIQLVDVRDVAQFVVTCIERKVRGAVNVVGPRNRDTMGSLLDGCIRVTGSAARLMWVDPAWLSRRGVSQWTELPLWSAAPLSWSVDASRAQSYGLDWRTLRRTLADTWHWLEGGGQAVRNERALDTGMSPQRESELLASWSELGSRRQPAIA